jgi:hypothetical protein
VPSHHAGNSSVKRPTELHFHRRMPSTKFIRYYVICSMHDRRKEIVYYYQDRDVALSVDGCFEVYQTSKNI